jgi:hypothetical protein
VTDISITSTAKQVENRSWLLGQHGTDPGTTPSVTLDPALFAGLAPNGYVPSGTAIAKVTATGLWGPADSTATDGRQTWTDATVGLLFGTLTLRTGATKVGGARVVHGFVNPTKLPFQSGAGAATTAVRTALRLIHFSA